jgi:hypothetical protein
MSKLVLNGDTSGSVTLESPAVSGTTTLTLPTTSGTIALSGGAVSGTTGSFSGDLSFNSGYGSAAVAYGCRAWVNFDGTANSNLTGTYSQTGTTVTVTITAHGYVTGQSAYLDFTSGTAVDGTYTVTVTDANTFTLTQASRTTSGNVTNRRNTIRASGNVTSITDNGTGDYTVNFTTAMPDANYSYQYGLENETTGANTVNKILLGYNNGRAADSLRVQVQYILSSTTTAFDLPAVCISVFR